jgi:hypothetical protein
MHRSERSNSTAAAAAIILVGIAIAMAWLAFSGSLDGATATDLEGPLAGTEIQEPTPAPLLEGMRIEASVQFAQPRDPFRPLITDSSATGGGDGGTGGTSGTGGTDGTTTTGTQITLEEIRDVNGVLRATVIVDGVSYDVGVGDEFAGRFQVVSLDSDGGVFLNGDNAFELSVGQQILK